MFPSVLDNNVQSSFRISHPCKLVLPGFERFLSIIVKMPRIGGRVQGDETHCEFWLTISSFAVVGENCVLPCLMKNYFGVFPTPNGIVVHREVSSPIVNVLDWRIDDLRHTISRHQQTNPRPI